MTLSSLVFENVEALNSNNFPSTPFLAVVRDLSALASMLGPPLYFAARDIRSKIEIMEAHLSEVDHPPHETAGYPLRLLVKHELRTNTADNAQQPSISRTFMRLVWFLDFVTTLCDLLCHDEERPVHECAREAYEQCLAPYHKMFVQVAVRVSLWACPSRETFLAAFDGGVTTLRELAMRLRPPVDVMWVFCRENKLDKLKH
jgi:hypothetical protein